MERFLLWLADFVYACPRRIAALCLVTAVVGIAVVSRMPLRTDLLEALPAGNPTINAFTDFLRDFGWLDGLVVVVESDKPSPETLMEAVESLGEGLATSILLDAVDYNVFRSNARLLAEHFPIYLDRAGAERLSDRLTPDGIRRQVRKNLEIMRSPFSSPLDGELVRRDPLNLREVVRDSVLRRFPSTGIDVGTGYYMDKSRTMAILTARPKGSPKDMVFVGDLNREIRRISDGMLEELGHPAGISIRVAGGYARAAEAADTIWRDMVVSFVTSFVLVFFLIYLSFRPSSVVLGMIALTLSCALSWTLLLAYFLYGALNIVTSIVAAVLIGMYVDYMLQMYKRFEEFFRKMGDVRFALRKAFSGTGKSLISGSFSTSIAFFSVVVTSFRGLRELGVVAGFGVLLCLAATFLLMGSQMVWLAENHPNRLFAGRPGGIRTGWLAGILERRSGRIALLFVPLFAMAIGGLTVLRFDAGVDSLGVEKSVVGDVEKRIQEKFGRRGEPLFLVARPASRERTANDFEAMERYGRHWREAGMVGSFMSPGMFLPPPSAQKLSEGWLSQFGLAGRYSGKELESLIRSEMERQRMVPDAALPSYAERVARALSANPVLEMSALSAAAAPRAGYFYNESKGSFAAHITSPGSRWESSDLVKLREDVGAMGPDFSLVGPALIFGVIRDEILWESGLAILISFVGNIFIVWGHFRSRMRVFLVMLPVTAGILLTVGTMGLAGWPFNFFNVAGIALIFGFGVDYGIYMMQSEIEDGDGGGSGSLRSVGGTVALCAATTMASCGSLVTTHYRGLASIGTVLTLGALYCLLGSLVLFPLALRFIGRKARAS